MVEPPPSLDGPRLKLARAEHHLEALVREAALVRADRYEFPMERDVDAPRYRPYLVFPEQRPLLPLLIGDWAHNARSCLDHLARQLVRTNGGKPKEGVGGTTFPVNREPGKRVVVIGGVHADALTVIEALQPDFRANPTNPRDALMASPLWVLNELANIDKHRFNLVHRMVVGDIRGEIFGAIPRGEIVCSGDLVEGATPFPDVPYFTSESGEVPEVHMDGQGTVDILLEVTVGPPHPKLVPLAEGITAFVRDALTRFSRFF